MGETWLMGTNRASGELHTGSRAHQAAFVKFDEPQSPSLPVLYRVCPGSPRCLFTGTVPAPNGVFEPVPVVWVCWRVWMVVRFVCVFRVLVCARE